MVKNNIYTVDPVIRWRDLFELNIPNENLKRRTETFLDVLERSAFGYEFLDSASGTVEDRYFSGQDLLRRVVAVRENLRLWLEQYSGSKIAEYFATTSIVKTGKFSISQHGRSFQRDITNGSQTIFVGNPTIGAYPIGFEIGTDYLRGAKYFGLDKKLHPVTVDAVVAHEIAHIAYNTGDEEIPIKVENIVAGALGAVQRENIHDVIYKKDANGGFWLLSHRASNRGTLKAEFQAQVISDFDTAVSVDRYEVSDALALTIVGPQIKL